MESPFPNFIVLFWVVAMCLSCAGSGSDGDTPGDSDDDTADGSDDDIDDDADDDGDDDDGDGDDADDDVSDDDDQDDDLCQDDDSEADDDLDLPTCEPYSFTRWFEISEDFDIDEFRWLAYEETLPACVVLYDGLADWTIQCNGWSIGGTWLDGGRPFPLVDGQDIYFYLEMFDDDIGLYAIWVLDAVKELVMFQVNTILNPSHIYNDVFDRTGEDIPHCSNHPKKVCRYSMDDTLPPLYVLSDYWLDVYGRDESGVLFGSPFHVPAPGETALSEDGKLEVRIVHSFEGTAWTEEPSLEEPEPHSYNSERTYIQAVVAP